MVYEFDDKMSALGRRYLGDTKAIAAAEAAVVAQGKSQ
jgi:hypothetical protein